MKVSLCGRGENSAPCQSVSPGFFSIIELEQNPPYAFSFYLVRKPRVSFQRTCLPPSSVSPPPSRMSFLLVKSEQTTELVRLMSCFSSFSLVGMAQELWIMNNKHLNGNASRQSPFNNDNNNKAREEKVKGSHGHSQGVNLREHMAYK